VNRLFFSRTFQAMVAIPLGALILGLFFWHLRNTDPMWAIVSFVLVYDPDMRTAKTVGLARLVHTLAGTGLALGLVYLFGLHKWLMPLGLALAALICGLVLRFRNSWRVLLITVTLVIGASLYNPAAGTSVALLRGAEVFAGSVLAITFSWLVARFAPPDPR
jgi:uncharacterized membrane protein YccC